MNFKNKFLCMIFFSFIIIISLGVVSAEDNAMPLIDEGSVSGDVDIATENPWETSGELSYTVPDDVSEIKSVNVIVNDYSGSGAPTYGLYSNVSLTVNNTTTVLGYETLVFGENTANDPTVYPINNHTTRQYDSYQMIYDITDNVKNLTSGDEIKISVVNTNMSGYSFDGRIKLIALIMAYNDGDNDNITYWLNAGQSWTKATRTNTISTKDFDGEYDFVTFENIGLSTYDATYKLNDKLLTDPIDSEDSHMFKYSLWDITDEFVKGEDTNFTYTASSEGYGSFKSVIQLLKVHDVVNSTISASIKPQYTNTIFAGVNNTLAITLNNTGKAFSGVIVLINDGEEVASQDVNIAANESKTVDLMDLTIRPVDETTVNGANNTKTNYTLEIYDSYGNLLNSTNASYTVLYNGNLGKDYAYPASNGTLTRVYEITGDVIVLNQNDSAYAGTGVTNRTSTWNVNESDVEEALLYVSYNWDKIGNDFNNWNITFNNVAITPIANYRDQSNMGTYGKYAYGLVVYNVTSLLADGENTLNLLKNNGSCAVYPATLLLLTNDNESETHKTVYIAENADLLSKYANIDSGAYTFIDIDTKNLAGAELYVFGAGAQVGEGNVVFNDETFTNVWNGTGNSIACFVEDITDIIDTNNTIYFQSTGSTILSLQTIIVCEIDDDLYSVDVSNVTSQYTNTIFAGVNNTLTINVVNSNEMINGTVVLLNDGVEIGSQELNVDGNSSKKLTFIDTKIRPVDETTVNGANNTKTNYTVEVYDRFGNLLNTSNVSFSVLYNGNLGKDYAYPASNGTITRVYEINGDVIILTQNDSAYAGTGVTNRTVTWNVTDLDVKEGLLYVGYNWDKIGNDFNNWNITFNNATIAPIANYRDQSNMGGYGKYGYGLVVYNVTDLLTDGENTLNLIKNNGSCAVYPPALILLTDNNESETYKVVYISENADLLSKYVNLESVAYTFMDLDSRNVIGAELYVMSAGAQKGEGNVIFNNETYTNVWNGSSNSLDYFKANVSGKVLDENTVAFESTGSTILALADILALEFKDIKINVVAGNDKYYGDKENLTINLTDYSGNPLPGKKANITLNGRNYTRTSNENGTISMAVNLGSGDYPVDITVDNVTVNTTLTIKPTVEADDVVKVFRNGTQFYATFVDSEGNKLKDNSSVEFNINGIKYIRKTTNGTAKLNINLPQGEYIITAYNPESGELKSNNITVLPRIIGENITKYFQNDTQYYVTLVDDNGNPVGEGESVKFNINGVFYTRKTNASGVAKLNINLPAGNYTVTAEYNNCTISNNIEVLSTLSAENLTKKQNTTDPFVVTLVDKTGQPYSNKTVEFNVNGVKYKRTTNETGQAKLNINLPAGIYIITSTYDGCSIANTINVTD